MEETNTPKWPKVVAAMTGAKLITMPRGDQTFPALIYAADEAPAKGAKIKVKLDNGVTYTGTVHDSTMADGEVLVELRDGLTPT